MSASENIKKLNQKFVENKSKENIESMSLETLAENWKDLQENNEENNDAEKFNSFINEELMQNKVDAYISDLTYGRFSPADFDNVLEFCSAMGNKIQNPDLKKQMENLQEQMQTNRLNMSQDVSFNLTSSQKDKFPIKNLDNVNISGNVSIIKDLNDRTQPAGKTFTFYDNKENSLGGVEFDKNNDAHILCTDLQGEVSEYKLTADNKFYKIDENQKEIELDINDYTKLATQDIKAFNLGKSAGLMWKKYTNKEFDKNIQKPKTTINEGEKKSPEKNSKDNKKKTVTKINESEEEQSALPTTQFNEETSSPKAEGDLNNETDNEHGKKPDELYWKEEDIIKVMFEDWFLAFMNSATNWGIHQIEYAAAGIWDSLRKSYKGTASEASPSKEEKLDNTQQFYNDIKKVSQTKTENYEKSSNNQDIIEQIKAGKLDEVLVTNDLLRNFSQQTGVDLKPILSKCDPEKSVPLLTSVAATYVKFADAYAQSSLLDSKMNSWQNHLETKPETLYEQKTQEAGKILKHLVYEEYKKNPNASNLKTLTDTLRTAASDMDKALNFSIKDFNKQNYDEQGKKPKDNALLHQYQQSINKEEPQTLLECAKDQSAIIQNRNFITAGFNNEKLELDAAQQDNAAKRELVKKTKNYIMGGLGAEKPMMNIIQPQIPYRPQGRE